MAEERLLLEAAALLRRLAVWAGVRHLEEVERARSRMAEGAAKEAEPLVLPEEEAEPRRRSEVVALPDLLPLPAHRYRRYLQS